jgi:hypothetical protein
LEERVEYRPLMDKDSSAKVVLVVNLVKDILVEASLADGTFYLGWSCLRLLPTVELRFNKWILAVFRLYCRFKMSISILA